MKSVRIYKDDIRVHILRSLFFTDSFLVISGTVIMALILYLVFHYILHTFQWSYYISALIVTTILFVTVVTQKIDNQPIYKIVPRLAAFKTSKKEKRYKELEPYFTDFTIQDNLILRANTLTKIFQIEPFDVALLNEQDRENFFIKLKQAIHTLPTQVQFIVRKERAETKDYSQHFFSLYAGSTLNREALISRYIKDLSRLLENETLFITRHYAVFSVSCNTGKTTDLIAGVRKVNDMGISFASALSADNITVKPLTNEELIRFMSSTLRS